MIYNLLDELRWKRSILLPPLILNTSSITACASNTIVGGIIRWEDTKKEQKKGNPAKGNKKYELPGSNKWDGF